MAIFNSHVCLPEGVYIYIYIYIYIYMCRNDMYNYSYIVLPASMLKTSYNKILHHISGWSGNPAPFDRWFIMMYPIIYRVSTIQGEAGCLTPTVVHNISLTWLFRSFRDSYPNPIPNPILHWILSSLGGKHPIIHRLSTIQITTYDEDWTI